MEEVIVYKDGSMYYRIYILKQCAWTQKASCYEIKRGQIVNGYKIKQKTDVWFPNYLPGGALGFFQKTIGITDAIYVHDSLYKKLVFV
jgi:hypothetical protein